MKHFTLIVRDVYSIPQLVLCFKVGILNQGTHTLDLVEDIPEVKKNYRNF